MRLIIDKILELQMWRDYSLVWNVSDFGGISVVRIPAEKVWKSDVILYNK